MSEGNSKRTWVTAEALKALAARPLSAGSQFTAGQLAQWTEGALTPEQRVHASTRLCALKFVWHNVEVIADERVHVYTVTPDGCAAVQAARLGHVRKSGPKTSRQPNPVKATAFSSRLWQLLRIRKMITPREAAATLCDAGGNDFERRRDTARKCLRRWASTGALAEGRLRLGAEGNSNGDKRYVLVVDSAEPPKWRKPKHAAATSNGGQT